MIANHRLLLAGDEDILVSKLLFDGNFLDSHAGKISLSLFTREPHKTVVQAIFNLDSRGEPFGAAKIVAEVAGSNGITEQFLRDELNQWLQFETFSEQRALEAIRQLRMSVNVSTLDRMLDDARRDIVASLFPDSQRIVRELHEQFKTLTPEAVSESITLADLMQVDPADEPDDVMRTGINFFDAALPDGGFHPSDLLFLSAPPKTGKTTLALQTSLGLLQSNPDLRITWAAGEMSLKKLKERAWMCMSRLTLGVLKRPWNELSPLQTQGKRDAMEELRDIGKRMSFVQSPLTIGTIEADIVARDSKFCVIDYLQLVKPNTPGSCRRDDVDEVVHQLERMSPRHEVAFFIISNQGKGPLHGRDIFSAFKESSEIPHAADIAIVGEIPGWDGIDELDQIVTVHWRCLKCRHGEEKSMMTRFDRPIQYFGVR